jgi:hypothetical protein
MRTRRVFKILAPLCLGLILLAVSVWAYGEETDPHRSADLVASMSCSLAQDRLEAEARHTAGNAVFAREAREARHAVTRRALRQRVSRGEPRSRPSRPAAPLIVPGAPDDVWAKLRRCEAGGDYRRNSGNGYYGAYQFSPATWRALGYPGLPHQAPPAMQDQAARRLQQRSGWGQWPACSRRIGTR